jgi:hypothetical protein
LDYPHGHTQNGIGIERCVETAGYVEQGIVLIKSFVRLSPCALSVELATVRHAVSAQLKQSNAALAARNLPATISI